MKLSAVTLGISSLAYFFLSNFPMHKGILLGSNCASVTYPVAYLILVSITRPQFANGALAQTGLESTAEIEKGLMLD